MCEIVRDARAHSVDSEQISAISRSQIKCRTRRPNQNWIIYDFLSSILCLSSRLAFEWRHRWPFGHKRTKDATNFLLIFSCLFCRFAALRTECCRTCDKCPQFRTFIIIIIFRCRLCSRWRENGKRETGGKKLHDGEPNTMDTKIDLLKEFVWTERLDVRRTWIENWEFAPVEKPKIEFSDVISLNEEKNRREPAITALSRDERRRANIANILFSGRCIATCQ